MSLDEITADDWDSLARSGRLRQISEPGKSDEVKSPEHYRQGDIECIEAIRSMLSDEQYVGYLRGNAMKYLWRMMHKHEDHRIDAEKSVVYMDWLLQALNDKKRDDTEGEPSRTTAPSKDSEVVHP